MLNNLIVFTEELVENPTWLEELINEIVATWDKLNVWIPATLIPSLGVVWATIKNVFGIFKKRKELKELDYKSQLALIEKMKEENNNVAVQQQAVLLKFLPIFKMLIETSFNEELKQKGQVLYNEVVKSINAVSEKAKPIVETFENLQTDLKDVGEDMVKELVKVEESAKTNEEVVLFTGE